MRSNVIKIWWSRPLIKVGELCVASREGDIGGKLPSNLHLFFVTAIFVIFSHPDICNSINGVFVTEMAPFHHISLGSSRQVLQARRSSYSLGRAERVLVIVIVMNCWESNMLIFLWIMMTATWKMISGAENFCCPITIMFPSGRRTLSSWQRKVSRVWFWKCLNQCWMWCPDEFFPWNDYFDFKNVWLLCDCWYWRQTGLKFTWNAGSARLAS